MTRIAVLIALLALAACASSQRPRLPGDAPLWQNAPSNATYEPAGSRPPGS